MNALDQQYFSKTFIEKYRMRDDAREGKVLRVSMNDEQAVVLAQTGRLERFTLIPNGETWSIISRGWQCEDCEKSGRVGKNAGDAAGRACPSCDGTGWQTLA